MVVVVVIEPSQSIGARIVDIEPRDRQRSGDLLAEARALLRTTGVGLDTEERIGDPAEELVRASERYAAD